jgi:hypothetical protein
MICMPICIYGVTLQILEVSRSYLHTKQELFCPLTGEWRKLHNEEFRDLY